ncbi:MAG: hypothetical protein HeimC2_35120 [Candidatus Heimdallarchaeota archaeon LC_2]|nr:MAG: hypothetical protein HeimC2_35120 [Candidatus Heimdallarchaeota archaeon LC_2]
MTSKKIPLSNQTMDEVTIINELAKLEKIKYLWIKITITGIITALGAIFVLFLIAFLFNFFNFGIVLELFNRGLLMVFFSAVYFLISGFSIWFGPSPQWADFKSRVLTQTIKPRSMSESLQIGYKHSVTGIVLLILAG